MTRMKLKNKFLKNRIEENQRFYTQQQNYCLPLSKDSLFSFFKPKESLKAVIMKKMLLIIKLFERL